MKSLTLKETDVKIVTLRKEYISLIKDLNKTIADLKEENLSLKNAGEG